MSVLLLTVLAAGCATTVGLDATETRSGFDGGRVVNIRPHGTACTGLPCISLGAQWHERSRAGALLEVQVTGDRYYGIQRAELSIDGRVLRLPGRAVTRFDRTGTIPTMYDSRQSFGVTLQDLRDAASARRVWVRVHTLDGYVEAAIVDGATDSKALHALRRFLAQVDGA